MSMATAGNSTMSRASLGQAASLGSLYDEKTDQFLGTSLFKNEIPSEAVTFTTNPSTNVELVLTDTLSEKFSNLDVNPSLQASVLAGLTTLEGSARYLNDTKLSINSVKASLLYKIKTVDEALDIFHPDLKDDFVTREVESSDATHVVVGISWGANTVLSCEHRNSGKQDIKSIEDSLTAQMTKISTSILHNVEPYANDDGDANGELDVNIRMFGDVIPPDQQLPTTFEEALSLLRQMSGLVANSNNGQGKPLTYYLFPLSQLKCYLNLPAIKEEASIKQVVQVFEQMTNLQLEINDLVNEITKETSYFSTEDLAKANGMKTDFVTMETQFRSNLAKILVDVRSGKQNASELDNLFVETQSDTAPSLKTMKDQLKSWNSIKEKISFVNSLGPNVKCIGDGVSLDAEILKHDQFKIYVLYIREEAKTRELETWRLNRELFEQLDKTKADCKYFIVDCDIHENLWPAQGICIEVYEQGKLRTRDLVAKQETTETTPIAQSTQEMTKTFTNPKNLVNLSITCPGTNCSQTIEQLWVCPTCKSSIEFGFDTFFYCGCGRAPASSYEFKCPDQLHGAEFAKHDESNLDTLLSGLSPRKELNILIMGKTGVGKSTWINGFINFLTFKTLAEAEQNEDLITLVPTKFTISDADYNQIVVSTGEDHNEVQETGQSATQSSKVYSFPVGDTLIRLIDTPGIGDSRGITQDKKNFQNILSQLSHFDKIHGICIFMKPNDSRLDLMFRFCINELLTYLHRDASRNVIFCFTNARSTFYRPGDTLPVLVRLLATNKSVQIPVTKNTTYCYDSEAFRYLAAIKNNPPVDFGEEDREDYVLSWEKSRTETERILKYIKGLTPHEIEHTMKLNQTRNNILKLTRPLAEIVRVIQVNKKFMEQHLDEIRRTRETINELEKKRTYTVQSVAIIPLRYPQTVCTNPSCKESLGPGQPARYKSICHDRCYLTGVTYDTIGHEELMRCDAMKPNGKCRLIGCNHSYREHMHVNYYTQVVTHQVEDETAKQLLNKNVTAQEMKEGMIEAEKEKIKENDAELNLILASSVKFSCFLNHNSIVPYNDEMVTYLNHLIEEERGKVDQGGGNEVLKNLTNYRDLYQKELKRLKKEIQVNKTAETVLSTAAVEDTLKELNSLKHNGKILQDALTNVNNHQQETRVVYREVATTNHKGKRGPKISR